MGLGLNTGSGGGSFLDSVRYNTKEGRIYRADSEKVGDDWVRDTVEISEDFTAAVDIASIQIGWIKFNNGVDKQLYPLGADIGPSPSSDHKQGFGVNLILGQASCGKDNGAVRELCGTAGLLIEGIERVFDSAMAQADVKDGTKVPVIALKGTERIVGKHGANFKPVFEIAGYAPRSSAFDEVNVAPVEEQESASDGDDGLPF